MQKEYTVLIIPGYDSSGPTHWQTLWEQENPDYVRVQQRDWLKPICSEWVQAVDDAIRSHPGPKVLVGHSLGCTTITKWAEHHQGDIIGALLVAPPDLESPAVTAIVQNFGSNTQRRLNFPSIIVASTNDIYCSLETSKQLASSWGSKLVTIESAGHINADSGFGPWPYGKQILQELCAKYPPIEHSVTRF